MSLSHLKIINDQGNRTFRGSKRCEKGCKKFTWYNFVVKKALTTHANSRSSTRIAKQHRSSKTHLLLLSWWSEFWNLLINHFWQVNKKGFMAFLAGLDNSDRVAKISKNTCGETGISGQLFDPSEDQNRTRAQSDRWPIELVILDLLWAPVKCMVRWVW